MKTLGDEIRSLRIAAGLTQIELAEKIGVTQGFVTNLETGRKSIATTKLLFALSDALGKSCTHFRPFLGGSPTPEEPAPAKPKRKK